jgi:hypothetical protein
MIDELLGSDPLISEFADHTIMIDGESSLMNPDFPLALQVPK